MNDNQLFSHIRKCANAARHNRIYNGDRYHHHRTQQHRLATERKRQQLQKEAA